MPRDAQACIGSFFLCGAAQSQSGIDEASPHPRKSPVVQFGYRPLHGSPVASRPIGPVDRLRHLALCSTQGGLGVAPHDVDARAVQGAKLGSTLPSAGEEVVKEGLGKTSGNPPAKKDAKVPNGLCHIHDLKPRGDGALSGVIERCLLALEPTQDDVPSEAAMEIGHGACATRPR